ncbi:hypothetical protein BDV12DRAFT_161750 [Aspergillus spectabilis]
MAERDLYVFENQSSIPPGILHVITTVLSSWDNPDTNYNYVEMFNPDGTLDVHDRPAKGRDEIHQLHAIMINPTNGPVVRVQHHVDKLYMRPTKLEGGRAEVIFTGFMVTYLKNGQEVLTDYASSVTMSPSEGGELRADYWKAFIDRSKVAEAIEEMF